MLQAISSTTSTRTAAVRPKCMTLVLDKKAGSSNDKYEVKETSKAKPKADAMASKPRTILSSNCYELNTHTTAIVGTVQLHLTSYRDILVMNRSSDNSHSQSVSRRHSVDNDSVKDHPIIPRVLLVESNNEDGAKQIYFYLMEKQKTVKQWVDKVQSLKREVSDQLGTCIANGGAKYNEARPREEKWR